MAHQRQQYCVSAVNFLILQHGAPRFPKTHEPTVVYSRSRSKRTQLTALGGSNLTQRSGVREHFAHGEGNEVIRTCEGPPHHFFVKLTTHEPPSSEVLSHTRSGDLDSRATLGYHQPHAYRGTPSPPPNNIDTPDIYATCGGATVRMSAEDGTGPLILARCCTRVVRTSAVDVLVAEPNEGRRRPSPSFARAHIYIEAWWRPVAL